MPSRDFQDPYEEVLWDLCVEAAQTATTDLHISVYDNLDPQTAPRARTRSVAAAAEVLLASNSGVLRVEGNWMANGKKGKLEVWCPKPSSARLTTVFVKQFIEKLVRLHIAKGLFQLEKADDDYQIR